LIANAQKSADVTLSVANIDPAFGAWHLVRWATRAIMIVAAGRSNAQSISGTAELLRAASINVISSILVDCDEEDDSIGLSVVKESPLEQPGGAFVVTPPSTST
jgi:hypothetical protein